MTLLNVGKKIYPTACFTFRGRFIRQRKCLLVYGDDAPLASGEVDNYCRFGAVRALEKRLLHAFFLPLLRYTSLGLAVRFSTCAGAAMSCAEHRCVDKSLTAVEMVATKERQTKKSPCSF